ncbi:hypothetical protein SODALDRAFT_324423 [Sodiomyces alkalinus F11]|uniref:Cytochrome c oxidase assembly protein COX20, mitochondrial n=1 Tax=Sodiomyces alkalinus (strain CBS 110278 / VKM F-3762 / F11) TaxID=1314773 RepID=A0A3N2PTZ0_SODAK|nr:hypothetical protein SODALDRAFT_324423 [Sodiomyces alkalinus F11]ROT37962.1 hypothetical protein SODALDRAFT_324423 [Sodiomyces alkalinus F11]
MANRPDKDEPESRQETRLGWLTSRGSSTAPESSSSSESSPSSSSSSSSSTSSTTVISNWDNATQSDLRVDPLPSLPEKKLTRVQGKLDAAAYRTPALQPQPHNAEVPTIQEAVKSIKTEDFLNVGKVPCARDGYIYGIITGGIVGGVKFMMSAPVPKVANWAVGGTIAGAAASFEWCQYKRRQERINMRRAVEVFQQGQKEKQRKEMEAKKVAQEEAAKREAEAAKQRSWYTFW